MAVTFGDFRTCPADTAIFQQCASQIDLLIYQNATLYPIEIKKSTQPKNAAKNFSVLKKLADTSNGQKALAGNGAVVCLAPDVIPIDGMNCYVPAWII